MSDPTEPRTGAEPLDAAIEHLWQQRDEAIERANAAQELARQAVGQRDDYRARLKAADEAYRLQCVKLCAAEAVVEAAKVWRHRTGYDTDLDLVAAVDALEQEPAPTSEVT